MILIVDDQPDTGEALCQMLIRQGYPCRWVERGVDALAILRQQPADAPLLVVLDEMMPDLSGMDVLRQLRSDPRTRHIPVIMYTAGFQVAKREESMALGVLHWIIKGQDMELAARQMGLSYERAGGVRCLQLDAESPSIRHYSGD